MQNNSFNIERIKLTELDMLKCFIECCKRLTVKYFLLGGSMLGAVRHQGFIPWDDDIDVGMLRKDYDIFMQKAQDLMPNYYFLQNRRTDPELPNNFAKIRDSRTTFIETSLKEKKINHGVYIDIFPLDYYPILPEEQREIEKENRILNLRIRKEYTLPKENLGSNEREFLKNAFGALLTLRYQSIKQALDKQEKLFRCIMNSRYITNFCGVYGRKEIVPIEWFGDGVSASFEGLSVCIPKEYDKYLTQIYGDYMTLPPIEKRKSHHYTEIIDLDRPYTYYTSQSRG